MTQLVADATGLTYEEPQFQGAGSVTIDGTDYVLSTTSCQRNGNDIELTAVSPDGTITLVIQTSALADIVYLEFEGHRWIQDQTAEVQIDGDTLTSADPTALVDQFTRDPAATITFSVICG
jgi:hypothetical protein